MSIVCQVPNGFNCGGIKLPVDGTNIAPFIRLSIVGSGTSITVGNQSDPLDGNTATIKSLQVGSSSGAGVRVEIIDEAGSDFENFMNHLNKSLSNAVFDYRMQVEFGWIDTSCGEGSGRIVASSPPVYSIPLMMESNYAEGKIKFTVVGTSLLEIVFETRPGKVYGGAGSAGMSIREAITKLFNDDPPKIPSVKFKRLNSAGQYVDAGFEKGPDGPIASWKADTQNKLSAALSWLETARSDKKKGWRPVWNPESATPEIIFLEDPVPSPGDSSPLCNLSIGTYIANGSNCSPVLSFNPTAKWVYQNLRRSGGTVGATSGKSLTMKEGLPPGSDINDADNDKSAGNLTSASMDPIQEELNGFKNGKLFQMYGLFAMQRANTNLYSMEGELRIQGDPSLASFSSWAGRTVSIVMINPFYISGSGNAGCGDWLANPAINPVYTNQAWLIQGLEHSIREGSFTTTIRVILPAPGSDIPDNQPFGGPGSGGFVPSP